jgi:ribosomal protein S18 acetylase RimI-like enzyme
MTIRDAGGDSVTFELLTSERKILLFELMKEFYEKEHLDFVPARAERSIEMMLNDPSLGKAWFVMKDGDVAGYCVLTSMFSLEFNGRTAFIDELYLREAFRGRGLGGQSVEFLCNECKRMGLHAVRLEVEEENEHAQHLYEKHRFRAHKRALMTRWLDSTKP